MFGTKLNFVLLVCLCACNGSLPPPAGTGDGDAPTNLPPGRACDDSAQCQSGFCIDLPAGKACAATCEGECGPGLVCKRTDGRDANAVSICVPPTVTLCEPCEDDSACGPYGDLCQRLGVDNDTFCTLDCTTTQICPQGFSCEPVENDDGEVVSHQCWPASNTCTCDELSAGMKRLCQATTQGVGTCLGEETCTPPVGWTGCDAPIPEAEVCDNVDNDCDLDVDEDMSGESLTRPCGYGPEPRRDECTGNETCANGEFGGCSLSAPPASETACDDLDNDCDGDVDEEFLNTVESCASCGDVCPPGPGFHDSTTRACLEDDGAHFCGPIGCRVPYFDVDGDEDNGCELADDHTRVGPNVIMNDVWSRAKRVAATFISAGDGRATLTALRLPHDQREHVPAVPPSPNLDFYLVESRDESSFDDHETEFCILFTPDPAHLLPAGQASMEVCWSNHYANATTAPSFPNCVTLDPHGVNERHTAQFAIPGSPDVQFHYIRVRSLGAAYAGSYAISAFDDVGCALY